MVSPKTPSTFSRVIIWSVISAAFIGPGTITTALSAGVNHGLDLLWAVAFATLACLILQEASARLVIASGQTLGRAITSRFGNQGIKARWITGWVVIAGCAAYEAGNILGAVSGLRLIWNTQPIFLTILISVVSGFILWSSWRHAIGWLMTALVALMGIAFLFLATQSSSSFTEIIGASVTPVLPVGSELLALGLIGTTIVPYNIFLGSGISKGQTLSLMRWGLSFSVIIGGAITAWILIAGTLVPSFSSFTDVAQVFESRVGVAGVFLFGLGLFAAGFSSAITSPYAAQIIGETVFEWKNKTQVRLIGLAVLLTGLIFGISGRAPIPIILVVQALNGLILPLLTALLIFLLNDPKLVPSEERPSIVYNFLLLAVLGVVTRIGLMSVFKSMQSSFGIGSQPLLLWSITGIVTLLVAFFSFRLRLSER